MDLQKLVAEVGKRHHMRIDIDDPVMAQATITEIQFEEIRRELANLFEKAVDQISAGAAQQEEAAVARGEKLITDGARFVVQQIKEAGEGVCARLREERDSVEKARRDYRREVRWYAWVCGLFALVSVAAVSVGLILM